MNSLGTEDGFMKYCVYSEYHKFIFLVESGRASFTDYSKATRVRKLYTGGWN